MSCLSAIKGIALATALALSISACTTPPGPEAHHYASNDKAPPHHAGFNGKHTPNSRVLAAGGYISGALAGS